MFKKLRKNEKGFTLAELLIVVAIIGVLVAISIPIFTSQLEKSREAVDAANIRAAYAEIMADAITDDLLADMSKYTVELKQETEGWQTEFDFPDNLTAGSTAPAKDGECSFTWDDTNKCPVASIKLTK